MMYDTATCANCVLYHSQTRKDISQSSCCTDWLMVGSKKLVQGGSVTSGKKRYFKSYFVAKSPNFLMTIGLSPHSFRLGPGLVYPM